MRSISEAHVQICQSEVNLLFALLANHSSASWPAAERERERSGKQPVRRQKQRMPVFMGAVVMRGLKTVNTRFSTLVHVVLGIFHSF